MKRIFLIFMAVFITGVAATAWAETSKEETRVEKDASDIDRDGGRADGEKRVVERLEKQFKVDESTITGLRDKKLGYGEIAIVLAMADKIGGVNAANINKIMAMRQGTPREGWGEIAKKLGFKLGPVISSVEKVRSEAHRDIEKAEHDRGKEEKHERSEKRERSEKHEKAERIDRPERVERPERAEKRGR